MYRFSRSIYRDLAPRIDASEGVERTFAAGRTAGGLRGDHQAARLATAATSRGRRRSLFTEVREHFAIARAAPRLHGDRAPYRAGRGVPRLAAGRRALDGQRGTAWPALARARRASASRCRAWTTAPRTSTSRRPSETSRCARSKLPSRSRPDRE